MKTKKNY